MKKSMMMICALLCASALFGCGKTESGSDMPKGEAESVQNEDAVGEENEEDAVKEDDKELTAEDEKEQAVNDVNVLGLTMTAEDVSRTGMKLVFTQSGGSPGGELYTGSYFRVEKYIGGEWSEVPCVFEGEMSWTAEAWGIPLDSAAEYPEKWLYYCGILPNGKYRIAKEIDDFRQPGDFDEYTYYAEFTIGDETPAARINVDGVTYACRGEISEFDRTCGTMSGFIASSVSADAMELEPDQSNFDAGVGYQRVNDTQYDVLIGGKWYAFIAEGSGAKPVKPAYASEVICPLGEDALKTAYPITAEESVTLHGIIAGAKWVEGTADCINDFRIDLSDGSVYYHSECGTFNDTLHGRSFTLDDETHELINRIVFQYAGTEIHLPEQPVEAETVTLELCGLPRKEDMDKR